MENVALKRLGVRQRERAGAQTHNSHPPCRRLSLRCPPGQGCKSSMACQDQSQRLAIFEQRKLRHGRGSSQVTRQDCGGCTRGPYPQFPASGWEAESRQEAQSWMANARVKASYFLLSFYTLRCAATILTVTFIYVVTGTAMTFRSGLQRFLGSKRRAKRGVLLV